MQDWKDKLGAAFNMAVPTPDEIEQARQAEQAAQPRPTAQEQQGRAMLNIALDRKRRKGKTVTLVTGLQLDDDATEQLAATLKKHCGVGGSWSAGEVLVQGDCRDKVLAKLQALGYKARII